MYPRYSLVLTVTHDCNMRCRYCYAGAKRPFRMSEQIGRRSIDRAINSLLPEGTLDRGFFGGEPLLEADLIERLLDYARHRARRKHIAVSAGLTTNGTVRHGAAWRILTNPDIRMAISHDGLPEIHDTNRVFSAQDGRRSTTQADRILKIGNGGKSEIRLVRRSRDEGGNSRSETNPTCPPDLQRRWKSQIQNPKLEAVRALSDRRSENGYRRKAAGSSAVNAAGAAAGREDSEMGQRFGARESLL